MYGVYSVYTCLRACVVATTTELSSTALRIPIFPHPSLRLANTTVHLRAPWIVPANHTVSLRAHNVTFDGAALGTQLIRVESGGSLWIDGDVTLRGGRAVDGGAVWVGPGASLVARGVTWVDNHASRYGGAVYADTSARVLLHRCVFDGNAAGRAGGALATSTDRTTDPTAAPTNIRTNDTHTTLHAVHFTHNRLLAPPTLVTDGSVCARPYRTVSACLAAAQTLHGSGALDAWMHAAASARLANGSLLLDKQREGWRHDPPFCYVEEGALKFNENGTNVGACTTSDACVCLAETRSGGDVYAEGETTVRLIRVTWGAPPARGLDGPSSRPLSARRGARLELVGTPWSDTPEAGALVDSGASHAPHHAQVVYAYCSSDTTPTHRQRYEWHAYQVGCCGAMPLHPPACANETPITTPTTPTIPPTTTPSAGTPTTAIPPTATPTATPTTAIPPTATPSATPSATPTLTPSTARPTPTPTTRPTATPTATPTARTTTSVLHVLTPSPTRTPSSFISSSLQPTHSPSPSHSHMVHVTTSRCPSRYTHALVTLFVLCITCAVGWVSTYHWGARWRREAVYPAGVIPTGIVHQGPTY